MVEVGRDLWRLSSPTPLLKQGHSEPAAQEHAQTTLESPQGQRLHNLHGQPVPALDHPHSENTLSDIQTEPALFQFVPIASGVVTGHP